MLATPWPTPAHDLQMRLNFEAAQVGGGLNRNELCRKWAAMQPPWHLNLCACLSRALPCSYPIQQAAQASAAAKKKGSKKRRTRRPRGYDSDEDWP